MHTSHDPLAGVAAGVPFVAVPPAAGPRPDAPIVVAWHLLDPPRTEAAFAAALPLAGLDAWRIYLGLPMTGSRSPAGGMDELMRLASEDAVLRVHGPIASQAAEEFGHAFVLLRDQLDLRDGPVGLVGGSIGSAVAQLVLAEGAVQAQAAVLVSPVVQLQSMIDALSRRFGVTYSWSQPSLAFASRLDFVARVGETARHGEPAVLLVVGEQDDADGFHAPARRLYEALATRYADPERVRLHVVPGMAHALAAEPGIEPAPQTPEAAEVDRHASEWLRQHLST
jgi:pimeloyl-ACP methyl ester carboxylesterase